MFRYRTMEITCYILYVKGKAKKQKAIVTHVYTQLPIDSMTFTIPLKFLLWQVILLCFSYG